MGFFDLLKRPDWYRMTTGPVNITIMGDVWQQKGLFNNFKPGYRSTQGHGNEPIPVLHYNPNQLIGPYDQLPAEIIDHKGK